MNMLKNKKIWIAPIIGMLVIVSIYAGCTSQNSNAEAKTSYFNGVPPEVIQYWSDWPLPHKDYNNSRATFTSTINSKNVNQLGLDWTTSPSLAGGGFGGLPTPVIVLGDTVYYTDVAYNIYSVKLSDGTRNWMHEVNISWIGPLGVAVGWGKVFGSLGPYDMGALDMKTGAQIWKVPVSSVNATKNLYMDCEPLPYDGLVYSSSAPHVGFNQSNGVPGWIYAFNQSNGVVQWVFNTIADPNWWDHPELNGGGGCWHNPAIDLKTGVMYWGVANPGNNIGPNGAYAGAVESNVIFRNGESRPGPNLYTNCMLALEHTGGALKWYQSAFPHDIFDHDFQNPPILATATMNGTKFNIVMGSGKAGVVFAFDRVSGAVLWKTPVGMHNGYDYVQALPDNVTAEVLPGQLGGVETAMAYANGILYAAYDDLPWHYTATGSVGPAKPFSQGTGGISAINVNTGKIMWDKKLPSLTVGGATVVNDLVFTGTYAGMLYAFNATTGEQVWSLQVPNGGTNGQPAVLKDMIVWPIGIGMNRVIALKLGASGSFPSS
jgi:outer membrane protein assembly factor BamB